MLNRENMKKYMLLITFAVLLTVGLLRFQDVWSAAGNVLSLFTSLFIGIGVAFMLNVPMRAIENTLQPYMKGRRERWLRAVSLVLTLLLVVGLIGTLLFLMVPELRRSVSMIKESFPIFANNAITQIEQLAVDYPEILEWIDGFVLQLGALDWVSIGKSIMDFLFSGNWLGNTMSVASSIIGALSQCIIGLVFALYFLLHKENLSHGFKQVLYAILPEQRVDHMLSVGSLTQRTFSDFISGQCLEACILGTMFFFTMTILRMPYALVIGVLIAFTALIPVFGAFVGCAVGVFLILIVDPMQALWFVVVFLVLQQIEGNLIYPRVVGSSVGLPSVFVLLAVTLGASTMGVLGMLIYIPLFSVIYQLVRQYSRAKVEEKGIAGEKFE